MDIICTYCSRDKAPDKGLMSAVDRYLSERIATLAAAAGERDCAFRILSGKFGLLAPDVAIPCYDHLLKPGEVDSLGTKVAADLREMGATHVQYFTAAPENVIAVRPYLSVMEAACNRASVPLAVVILPGDPV